MGRKKLLSKTITSTISKYKPATNPSTEEKIGVHYHPHTDHYHPSPNTYQKKEYSPSQEVSYISYITQ